MATRILIAHTGQSLEVDSAQFQSMDEFKAWLSHKSSIPTQNVVTLTSQGRTAKFASLHAEEEIFVYDTRITLSSSVSKNSAALASEIPLPKPYQIPNAPNSIEDVKSISSWQNLYRDRRTWAVRLAEDCEKMDSASRSRFSEMDVIIKCLDAAVANLEFSVKQLEPKYLELKKWVAPALEEYEQLTDNWRRYLDLAKHVTISPALAEFMTQRQADDSQPTLEDLLDLDTAHKAGTLSSAAGRRFSEHAAELERSATKMYKGLKGLVDSFDALVNRSILQHSTDSASLLSDIEAVVRQVDTDYQAALSMGSSQKDLAHVSKTASNHTERLVPNLRKYVTEMDDMIQYSSRGRNSIASEFVQHMQTITEVTSLHNEVKSHMNVLGQSNEDLATFDYLRLIHQVPYMYASFTVEAIRRSSWIDKVKLDSSTLANEMALFQDEESKRRRRWQKMVGSTYGPALDTNVMGLELNLLGEDNDWPVIPNDEPHRFLAMLREHDTDQGILDDVAKLVQELQMPTKQQVKRLKAFKNGSVHEAALGRSGLLLRGDDDLLRTLQEDKGRLDNKLKTAESRVRRLEDLLHRQSQATRPPNLFQPQSPQPSAQYKERRDSVSSAKSPRLGSQRRPSDSTESLLRRVTQLEAQLTEEKGRSARFEREMQSQLVRKEELQDQIQEANSTKKDLLENMEALKREFIDERKSLEDDIKSLKSKLEDTEDEIEHFGESRDHEKATYDQRVSSLETEVDRLQREAEEASLKSKNQVDYLRQENETQRKQLETVERDLSIAKNEQQDAARMMRDIDTLEKEHHASLSSLHRLLAPDQDAPDEGSELHEALAILVGDLVTKFQNSEADGSVLQTELDKAHVSTKEIHSHLQNVESQLSDERNTVKHLQENLGEANARVSALESELLGSRQQLKEVRSQLLDGENGSEHLQKRLEEEEARGAKLAEQLANRQSHVGSLEEELRSFKDKLDSEEKKLANMTALYGSRDERSKDLTHRLYNQNDRLTRLLDRMGYTISHAEGKATITKIPRAERTSQNPNDSSDPGTSIRRSISIGSKALADSADLDLLYWFDESDRATEEEKYNAFLESLGHFDVDQFAETIYYRVKETEHKARKWQRDARAYRDRAHATQKDAHDKIAFRHFKEGDLALFLPTRNQQAGAWAAFNVGFPHYFLREQDGHKLRQREWLVARISKMQERVVDLSKSTERGGGDAKKDEEDDNPFQLSDGLRWYLIDASEDKPGAPSTPGMGKSTVAANTVEATANIHSHSGKGKGKSRDSVTSIEGINKTLSKSLESRRSSTGSKKAVPFAVGGNPSMMRNSAVASETNSLRAAAPGTPGTPLATSPNDRTSIAQVTSGRPGTSEGDGAQTRLVDDHGAAEQQQQRQHSPRRVVREESSGSPSKKSVVWDSLWSVDYAYQSPSKS